MKGFLRSGSKAAWWLVALPFLANVALYAGGFTLWPSLGADEFIVARIRGDMATEIHVLRVLAFGYPLFAAAWLLSRILSGAISPENFPNAVALTVAASWVFFSSIDSVFVSRLSYVTHAYVFAKFLYSLICALVAGLATLLLIRFGLDRVALPKQEREGLRVLVIEDDYAVRRIVQLLLFARGYATEGHSTVRAARRALSQSSFDIVLSDHNLPDGDGLDVLRLLKETRRACPLLVMSSEIDSTLPPRLLSAGVAAFLPKPVEAEVLLATLLEHHGRSHRLSSGPYQSTAPGRTIGSL